MCAKTVYQMEKLVADKLVYHKVRGPLVTIRCFVPECWFQHLESATVTVNLTLPVTETSDVLPLF